MKFIRYLVALTLCCLTLAVPSLAAYEWDGSTLVLYGLQTESVAQRIVGATSYRYEPCTRCGARLVSATFTYTHVDTYDTQGVVLSNSANLVNGIVCERQVSSGTINSYSSDISDYLEPERFVRTHACVGGSGSYWSFRYTKNPGLARSTQYYTYGKYSSKQPTKVLFRNVTIKGWELNTGSVQVEINGGSYLSQSTIPNL